PPWAHARGHNDFVPPSCTERLRPGGHGDCHHRSGADLPRFRAVNGSPAIEDLDESPSLQLVLDQCSRRPSTNSHSFRPRRAYLMDLRRATASSTGSNHVSLLSRWRTDRAVPRGDQPTASFHRTCIN